MRIKRVISYNSESITGVNDFLERAFPKIRGFSYPENIKMLNHLQYLQEGNYIIGNVAEIGVFNGLFLIAMSHTMPLYGEVGNVIAIDPFGLASGDPGIACLDDLMLTEENISKYGRAMPHYTIIQEDSISLNLADRIEIMKWYGPFKLFSIDGCHSKERVLCDILMAQDMLCPGGVLIIDDFFHPAVPGVTEAVQMVQTSANARLKPFLFCHNKLYLTDVGSQAKFFNGLVGIVGINGKERQITSMWGTPILTIYKGDVWHNIEGMFGHIEK